MQNELTKPRIKKPSDKNKMELRLKTLDLFTFCLVKKYFDYTELQSDHENLHTLHAVVPFKSQQINHTSMISN